LLQQLLLPPLDVVEVSVIRHARLRLFTNFAIKMSGAIGTDERSGKQVQSKEKKQSLLGGNISEKFDGSSKDLVEEE
jgi:hypothetical protein